MKIRHQFHRKMAEKVRQGLEHLGVFRHVDHRQVQDLRRVVAEVVGERQVTQHECCQHQCRVGEQDRPPQGPGKPGATAASALPREQAPDPQRGHGEISARSRVDPRGLERRVPGGKGRVFVQAESELGAIAMAREAYAEAKKRSEGVLHRALLERSTVYLKLGKKAMARKDLERILVDDPSSVEANEALKSLPLKVEE